MAWQGGMDVDPVAYATLGNYTETYGVGEEANLANLFASWGMLEDAPNISFNIVPLMDYYFKRRNE